MINIKNSNVNLNKWVSKNDRRKKRDENIKIMGTLFAFTFINIILLMNFILGPLRLKSYSEKVVTFLIIELFAVIILSLILPNLTIKYLEKIMKVTGSGITQIITYILLSMVFILSLPFAKKYGLKSLLKRHPKIKPWVNAGNWDAFDSTWIDKNLLIGINKDKSNIKNILLFFLAEKNLFLLPIVAIIIIIATFMLIASAPVVAPFIYPL